MRIEQDGCRAFLEFDSSLDRYWLRTIRTDEDKRRQGVASQILRLICDFVDRSNTELYLHPKPERDSSLDEDGLRAWFERYGFESVEQSNKNLMVRAPRPVNVEAKAKAKTKNEGANGSL